MYRGLTLALGATVGLGGCHVVFGLDEISADAPLAVVTGRFRHRTVESTVTGEPLVMDLAYEPGLVSLSAMTDDSAVPLTVNGDGTFTLEVAGPYRVEIASGDDLVEIQTDVRHLELGRYELGRRNRVAITTPQTLTVDMGATANAGLATVVTTGVWAALLRVPAEGSLVDFAVDWRTAATFRNEPVSLLDGTQNDRIYYARFEDLAPTPTERQYTIAESAVASLTQTVGAETLFAATTIPAPGDLCLHAVIDRFAEHDRLDAAWPFVPSSQALVWQLVALSAPTFPTPGDFSLVLSPSAAATGSKIDQEVRYSNVYPGTQVALKLSVSLSRQVALGTAAPLFVSAGSEHVLPIDSGGDCGAIRELTGTIPLPTNPMLAGTRLDSDSIAVAIDRTQRVPLAWDAGPGVGQFTATLAELGQVGMPPMTITTRRTIRQYRGAAPSFSLDPSLLEIGHTYIITMTHHTGMFDAAAGNFVGEHPAEAPTSGTNITSSTFVIAN